MTRPAPRDMPTGAGSPLSAALHRLLAIAPADLPVDIGAVLVGKIADLHEGIDEEAKPDLRRQAAGADMGGGIDEAEILQVIITLRTEAGESDMGSSRDRLRDPSGSPLSR